MNRAWSSRSVRDVSTLVDASTMVFKGIALVFKEQVSILSSGRSQVIQSAAGMCRQAILGGMNKYSNQGGHKRTVKKNGLDGVRAMQEENIKTESIKKEHPNAVNAESGNKPADEVPHHVRAPSQILQQDPIVPIEPIASITETPKIKMEPIITTTAEKESTGRSHPTPFHFRKEEDQDEEYRSPVHHYQPREVRVPESPLARVTGFAGLGAKILFGVAAEVTKSRIFGSSESESEKKTSSPLTAYLGDKGADQIATTLSRMRGAALKLGQMLSIQDDQSLPPEFLKAMERVRQNADIMPKSQLDHVMTTELGKDWMSKFQKFDAMPMAAASIGQVHYGVLLDGRRVAVKVQYPGVAKSIKSDLDNLKRLVTYTGLIPRSAYLEEAIVYGQEELARECQYRIEASNQMRFKQILGECPPFYVPSVVEELSSDRILTTEFAKGKPIDKFTNHSQEVRDKIGSHLLNLTMRELFEFKFMQTDPNFSNFLYDPETETISLLDFGAAREFSKDFVDLYLRMVYACAEQDRDAIIYYSKELGFLTGFENKTMLDAHTAAAFVVGEPFSTKFKTYNFREQNVSGRTASFGKTLMENRLCPPPVEAYALHRRLSGAYLTCMKLQAVIPCRDMLLDLYKRLPEAQGIDSEMARSKSKQRGMSLSSDVYEVAT